jgi:hypothetical protein
MGKFEGKMFSSVEQGPKKLSSDGGIESCLGRVLKPTRAYWHRSEESKDQRYCYVSIDTTFYGNWSSSKAATLPSYHACVK